MELCFRIRSGVQDTGYNHDAVVKSGHSTFIALNYVRFCSRSYDFLREWPSCRFSFRNQRLIPKDG